MPGINNLKGGRFILAYGFSPSEVGVAERGSAHGKQEAKRRIPELADFLLFHYYPIWDPNPWNGVTYTQGAMLN
jgi:hypothetical protein